MIVIYILPGIVGVLILIRLLLPLIAVRFANNSLNRAEGLRGNIRAIGFNLLGGLISVKGIELSKRDARSGIDTMNATVESLDIRIPIFKLIRKKFEGKITVVNPNIVYAAVLETPKVKARKKNEPVPAVISPLRTALEKAPALNLNVDIVNGTVRYINHTSKPKLDVTVSAINVQVLDFTNRQAISDTAIVNASAALYGGRLDVDMKLKPMREQLTFDLQLELEQAEMVQLNPYFREFANIDVNAGTLGVYLEMAAEHGAFNGYLKPILKDMDVIGAEDSGDSFFKRVWERGVAAVFQLLENNRTNQVATKIPFEGRLDDPHVQIGAAIAGVLKNAFIRALKPSFDTTFNLESVYKTTKGVLSRFFT